MKKVIAVALLASTLIAGPATAAPIVYKLSGFFTGVAGDTDFRNARATFTGIGDTDTRTFKLDANFVRLSSLTLSFAGGATYTLSDQYDFWSAPTPFGSAGFKTVSEQDKLAFRGSALFDYDNNGSLAPAGMRLYQSAAFATDRGQVSIADAGELTFEAAAGAVPEPATWGMMILGFGLVGAAMRRRRTTVRTGVRFA